MPEHRTLDSSLNEVRKNPRISTEQDGLTCDSSFNADVISTHRTCSYANQKRAICWGLERRTINLQIRMYQRHKQKTSIGPKQKNKNKKYAHVLGATCSQIRKQNRRGSKSMHNDNNRRKRGKQKQKAELHKGHGSFTLPPIMSQQSSALLWTATSDKV